MLTDMEHAPVVIGIGELLWDELPDGKKLGGAPCNFVYHAQYLGAEAYVFSALGNDEDGHEIVRQLETKRLSTQLIQMNGKPTSTVSISLDRKGVPTYVIHEDVAWDYLQIAADITDKMKVADIVCFGSLAQRSKTSHDTILTLLSSCKHDALVVFDINLRQHYYTKNLIEESLKRCNVLKMNEDELQILTDIFQLESGSEEDRMAQLMAAYHLKLIICTKGAVGSTLMTPSQKSYLETPVVEVKDTVGAGDSFTAATMIGFFNNDSLPEILKKAVELSSFVCTQEGAMPEYIHYS
jgi:fructokinase